MGLSCNKRFFKGIRVFFSPYLDIKPFHLFVLFWGLQNIIAIDILIHPRVVYANLVDINH